ncbi:ThiF family adenylyltransferase [Microbacterium sp. Bi128]|uniref:ThiF family adenylyltransferase n=1 Tax=Microbacterium sp. Bi128 TaxID=2821115 RepID=UPI001DBFD68E|nr:ThiF family adenylyltransferase [Microbacterium sp. Bi128]CAH0134140.1 Sulfur carrier protein ThiS adenylyltransferase [Microbacterium sp. Bi128]
MHESHRALRLNYSLIVAETDDGLAVDVADAEPITLQGDYDLLLSVLEAIDGTTTGSSIADRLSDRYAQEQVEQALAFAKAQNLVKDVGTEDAIQAKNLGKWDRQIRNFTNLSGVGDDEAVSYHERLARSHILVLGVGGVGGYVASAAAMIGVGRLTIADFDTIELSNTSRQILYTEADLGRPKLEVAIHELVRRAPAANIIAIDQEVTDDNSMQELIDRAVAKNGAIDLLILCADHPRGRIAHIVDRICIEAKTPYLLCSPHDLSWASVGPLVIPGVTSSYSDMFPENAIRTHDARIRAVNERFVANIMEPYNGLAAKMALVEAVKFITGYAKPFAQGRVVDLDTTDWSVSIYEVE